MWQTWHDGTFVSSQQSRASAKLAARLLIFQKRNAFSGAPSDPSSPSMRSSQTHGLRSTRRLAHQGLAGRRCGTAGPAAPHDRRPNGPWSRRRARGSSIQPPHVAVPAERERARTPVVVRSVKRAWRAHRNLSRFAEAPGDRNGLCRPRPVARYVVHRVLRTCLHAMLAVVSPIIAPCGATTPHLARDQAEANTFGQFISILLLISVRSATTVPPPCQYPRASTDGMFPTTGASSALHRAVNMSPLA